MDQFYETYKTFLSLFLLFVAVSKSHEIGEMSLFLFDGDKIRFILNMICVRMANLWKAVENGCRSTRNAVK